MQQPFITMRRVLVGLCCLVLATVGVAYAAFTSNDVRIPSNSISTASANLELSDDGEHFSRQLSGYEFTNLVPGGAPSADRQVFLRNSGSTRLSINLLLTQPTAVQVGATNLNMNLVYIGLTQAGDTAPQPYSFESFKDGQPKLFGSTLEPGQVTKLALRAWVDEGALSDTTEQAVLENFNMVFGGVAGPV